MFAYTMRARFGSQTAGVKWELPVHGVPSCVHASLWDHTHFTSELWLMAQVWDDTRPIAKLPNRSCHGAETFHLCPPHLVVRAPTRRYSRNPRMVCTSSLQREAELDPESATAVGVGVRVSGGPWGQTAGASPPPQALVGPRESHRSEKQAHAGRTRGRAGRSRARLLPD